MPVGHREKSLRSRPAQSVSATLVDSESCFRETPRWRRMRRRLGPNALLPLIPKRAYGKNATSRAPATGVGESVGFATVRTVFQHGDYDFGATRERRRRR